MFNHNINGQIEFYDHSHLYFYEYLRKSGNDNLSSFKKNYRLETSIISFIENLYDLTKGVCNSSMQTVTYKAATSSNYVIELKEKDEVYLIVYIDFDDNHKDPYVISRITYEVSVIGDNEYVYKFYRKCEENIKNHKLAEVAWWYKGSHGAESTKIILDQPNKIYPEFYPFMEKDIDGYFNEFVFSDENVLFLTGEPGTGKTSLLRHFLHTNNLRASVTYDTDILSGDGMFINFITSKDSDVLIVENADLIGLSREHSNNKLMSKFLNISDGLIKFKDKKIIFTTNLNNLKDVDEALIRPGRCFDIVRFRPLTYKEAVAAAKVANIDIPSENKEYTLAELFNRKKKHHRLYDKKIGF